MFIDLTPQRRARLRRCRPIAQGNLYTGANTEDTPTIVEAAAFRHGIVMAQVNEIVDELPRVDIPGSWVDVVVAGRPAVRRRAAVHARSATYRRVADPHGDDDDSRHLRASWRDGAEPRHRLRHRRDRIAAADLWRAHRAEGQDLHALGAQSASHADPRHRERLGGKRALLRQRSGHGGLHRGALRRVFHGPRRQPAFEPRAVPACGSIRRGSLHRLDPADGCRRKFIDRHARPARRIRRRAEHGARSARTPAQQRGVAEVIDRPNDAIGRGRKLVVQTVETFKKGGEPTYRRCARCGRGRQAERHADRAGDDLRRRRQSRRHGRRDRVSATRSKAWKSAAPRCARSRGSRPSACVPMPRRRPELRERGIVAYPEDLGIRRERSEAFAAGGTQHRRSGRVVGRAVSAAGAIPRAGERDGLHSTCIHRRCLRPVDPRGSCSLRVDR